MENTNKEKVATEVVEFKESFNLTEKEINDLDKVICKVERFYSKKSKNSFYSLEVRFDGKVDKYKLTISLNENEYNHFVRKNNLDVNKGRYVCKLPVRFICGVGKNDIEYKSFQVFLSNQMAKTSFFKHFDLVELEDLKYDIKYVTRNHDQDIELDLEF